MDLATEDGDTNDILLLPYLMESPSKNDTIKEDTIDDRVTFLAAEDGKRYYLLCKWLALHNSLKRVHKGMIFYTLMEALIHMTFDQR